MVGLDAYMPRVRQMIRRYGYRAIYLATDSEAVLEALTNYPQVPYL